MSDLEFFCYLLASMVLCFISFCAGQKSMWNAFRRHLERQQRWREFFDE